MKKKGISLDLISKYRSEIYGISILLIIFFHFSQVHSNYYGARDSVGASYLVAHFFEHFFGSIGVEMFTFMSGVSMYYAFSSNNDIIRFYRRRYKRILIPYFYVGLVFWFLKDILILKLGGGRLLADFFFVTFVTEGVRTIWFILFLAISYLMLPFIYMAVFRDDERSGWPAAILIIGIALLLPVFVQKISESLSANTEILTTRLPLFVLGVILGKFVKEKKQVPYSALVLLTAFTAAVKYHALYSSVGAIVSRYSQGLFGLFLLAVIAITLHGLDKASAFRRFLRFFGNHSLELYLLHVTIRNLAATLDLQDYRISRFAIIILISIVLSSLLSRLTKLTGKCIDKVLCRDFSSEE